MRARPLVLALSLAVAAGGAAAGGAQAADCDDATTQLAMDQCAGAAFKAADAALNRSWGPALSVTRRTGGDAAANLLRKGQRAWLAFRDADCAAKAATYSGGTMAPLAETQCRTRLTLRRVEDLEQKAVTN